MDDILHLILETLCTDSRLLSRILLRLRHAKDTDSIEAAEQEREQMLLDTAIDNQEAIESWVKKHG